MEVFYKKGAYRIIIEPDYDYNISELKGDMFKPERNPDINEDVLMMNEQAFIDELECQGCNVASLEKWNPEIGEGWNMIDCIGGFVGDSFKGSGYDTEWIELINEKVKL